MDEEESIHDDDSNDYLSEMAMDQALEDKADMEEKERKRKEKKTEAYHEWYMMNKEKHKDRVSKRRDEVRIKIRDDRKRPDFLYCEICGRPLVPMEQKFGECNVCRLMGELSVLRNDVNKLLEKMKKDE